MSKDPGDFDGSHLDPSEILKNAIQNLDRLEERELSQTRILVLLLERDLSVADLVANIYGKRPHESEYRRLYMRISRRLISLQGRGLISRALFGKERPYRITRLGRRTLTQALSYGSQPDSNNKIEKVWGKPQTVMVLSTVFFLFIASIWPPNPFRAVLAYTFFLLLGVSISVVSYALREVL